MHNGREKHRGKTTNTKGPALEICSLFIFCFLYDKLISYGKFLLFSCANFILISYGVFLYDNARFFVKKLGNTVMRSNLELYAKSVVPISPKILSNMLNPMLPVLGPRYFILNPLASDFVRRMDVIRLYVHDLISDTVIDNASSFNLDPSANVVVDINTTISNSILQIDHHANILPATPKMLNPHAKPFVPRNVTQLNETCQNTNAMDPGSYQYKSPEVLSVSMQLIQSENNVQLSPDYVTYDTPNLSEKSGESSPDCFTIDTPNSSEIDNYSYFSESSFYSKWSEYVSLSRHSPEGSRKKSELNPEALAFVSKKIESKSQAEKYNDQDTSYSILKDLRLNNVNKIIIGHININSIRNKFDLLADLIKDN